MIDSRVELHEFFPTVVQVSDVEDPGSLNERLGKGAAELMRTVPNSKPEAWACTLYTTIASGFDVLEREPFSELKPFISQEVSRYIDSLALDPSFGVRISESWINVYDRGHAQEAHQHANNVISGIYYIQAPPGCSNLMFYSPVADTMIDPPTREPNRLNSMAVFVPVKVGRLVLFRSYLRHSVPPNNATGHRVSLAFNVQL